MRVMKRVWLCIALGILSILFKGCGRKPVETPPQQTGNVEVPSEPPADPPVEPEPSPDPPTVEPMYGVIIEEPEYGPPFEEIQPDYGPSIPYEDIRPAYGVVLPPDQAPNRPVSPSEAPVDGLETNGSD